MVCKGGAFLKEAELELHKKEGVSEQRSRKEDVN